MAVRTDFASGEVLAAADLNDTFGAKLNLAGGKILQVVRATDNTNRVTSSGTFVDATISVTITPQKSTSAILLIMIHSVAAPNNEVIYTQITDNSNNAISGAEQASVSATGTTGVNGHITHFGYSTPGTTSAVTYKGRFRTSGGNGVLVGSVNTSQLYAIEVSA